MTRRREPEPDKPTGGVRRRPRPEPAPAPPAAKPERPVGTPPRRMQDVMGDLGTPVFVGVDPVAAEAALRNYLRAEKNQIRPYCTHIGGPFAFDPQYGCYVHSEPKCWKPSKAMYEACLRAGILGEVKPS